MPKIIENGKVREMTQEEIEKTENLPTPEPTPEERLLLVEEALKALETGIASVV